MTVDLMISLTDIEDKTYCSVNVVSKLPLGIHTLQVRTNNSGIMNMFQHVFMGTACTIAFQGTPELVTFFIDGVNIGTYNRKTLHLIAKKMELADFIRKLLNENPTRYRYIMEQ